MKYLGIDYGTRRVGIAISDDDGSVAFPDEVIQTTDNLVSVIKKKIQEHAIDEIVIGESHSFSGEENPVMKEIQTFVKKLKSSLDVPVHFEPEYLTSVQAGRIESNRKNLDASAAALILQSYLDRQAKAQ